MKVKTKIDYKDTQIKVKVVKSKRPPMELNASYGDSREFGAIKRVYISSRHIDEINDEIKDVLKEYNDMDMLWIAGNVEKIKGLKNLPNLKFLFLNGNKIKKIEGLDNLPNLRLLKLERNDIKKIECLDHLVKLRHLDLNNNDIEKIEGLGNLVNLEYLNLYRNPVYRWAKRNFGGISMDRKKMKNPLALVRYCQTGEIPKRPGFAGGEIEASAVQKTGGVGPQAVTQSRSKPTTNTSESFIGLDIDFSVQRICPSCGIIMEKGMDLCQACGINLKNIKSMADADEIALEFAKTALKDPNSTVRKEAVETLGSFKEEYSLGVLTYLLLNDPNEEVRKEAADELGDLHHPLSVEVMKKALKDKSAVVRKEVIGSLKKLKKKVVDKEEKD